MIHDVVVISDIHLHFWKAFAKGHGVKNSRFNQTLKVVSNSLELARSRNCPWICAGDWVHTIGFAHTPVLTHLIFLLNEYPNVRKYIVWGNHDARSKGGDIDALETIAEVLKEAVEGVTVLNGDVIMDEGGLSIYGEGYQPDVLNLTAATSPAFVADVGVFHQVITGTALPNGMRLDHTNTIPKEMLWSLFTLSVVGDVHHPQIFPTPIGHPHEGRLALVPGSPEHHNFGDHSDHGYWHCVIKDGEVVNCRLIKSSSPEFITVGDVSEVKEDHNYYRITSPTDPTAVPENAIAAAPALPAIANRPVIEAGSSLREVLETWIRTRTPLDGSIDHSRYIDAGLALVDAAGPVAVVPSKLTIVKMKNFLCYEDQTLTITAGVSLVLGQSRDFDSNGAGKTSIWEAVFWCLFGKTTKGVSSDEIIRRGAGECTVSLLIDFEDRTIGITRSRKSGESPVLEVLDIGGEIWPGSTKDVTHALNQTLGITPELFQALCYFSQSKLVLFSQATDSERKAMLSDLCGLGVYQDASAGARQAVSSIDAAMAVDDATLSIHSMSVEKWEGVRTDLNTRYRVWKDASIGRGTQARNTFNETSGQLQNAERIFEQKEDSLKKSHEAKLLTLSTEVAKATEELRRENQLRVDQVKKDADVKLRDYPEGDLDVHKRVTADEMIEAGHCGTRISVMEKELAGIEAEVRIADADLAKARVAGECPTCGQAIDESTREDHERHAAHRLSTLVAAVDVCITSITHEQKLSTAHIERAMEANCEIGKLETREHIVAERIRRLEEIAAHYTQQAALIAQRVESEMKTDLRLELARLDHSHDHWCNEVERDRKAAELTIKQISDEGAKFESSLAEAASHQEQSEIFAKEVQDRIDQSRESRQINRYWADGFSRTGVQSLLIDEIAAAFNEVRAQVFPTLTRGIYDVQFVTVSMTKADERREKTDFIVRDRGALVTYESLSGGQRRRVDLGVMLSLALAISKTRQAPGVLGMLILDEVFGFLDTDGAECLYEVLEIIQQQIPAIYAVTHNPSLQSLFRNTVMVTQGDHGTSTITSHRR